MTLPREEVKARIAALQNGPWTPAIAEARGIAGRSGSAKATTAGGVISLDHIRLSPADRRKSNYLATLLRPHFETLEGIKDPGEQERRDTFDMALTLLQLYELAIQTGYLPAESVRKPARRLITELLWSAAARRFVEAYDYAAIPMLATRLKVFGFAPVIPPAPDPNAATRFAGFLAHFRAFNDDELIGTWTRFLDDYIVPGEEDERDVLRRYLRATRKRPPGRVEELMSGCKRFVASLVSGFDSVDADELGRFGLVHAYWLQKFFGYHMVASGYQKNVALWGQSDSWARTFVNSPRLVPDGVPPKVAELARREFASQVSLLEKSFAEVRSLVRSTRMSAQAVDAGEAKGGARVGEAEG